MFDGKHQLIRQSEAVGPENQIHGKEKGKPRGRSRGLIGISLQAMAPRNPAEQLHTPSRPTLCASKQAREPQSTSTAPAEKTPAARFITKTAYPFTPYHRIPLINTERQTPRQDIVVKRKRKRKERTNERMNEGKKERKKNFTSPAFACRRGPGQQTILRPPLASRTAARPRGSARPGRSRRGGAVGRGSGTG